MKLSDKIVRQANFKSLFVLWQFPDRPPATPLDNHLVAFDGGLGRTDIAP